MAKTYTQLRAAVITYLKDAFTVEPSSFGSVFDDIIEKMEENETAFTQAFYGSLSASDDNPFTEGLKGFALAISSGQYTNLPGTPTTDLTIYQLSFLVYNGTTTTVAQYVLDLSNYYTKDEVDAFNLAFTNIDNDLRARSNTTARNLIKLHNKFLTSKGWAFTDTDPVVTINNNAFIAAESGAYPNFNLSGVTVGQIIRYSDADSKWINEDFTLFSIDAIANIFITQHDAHCTPKGWANIDTEHDANSISGLPPGDPELEYPIDAVDTYLASVSGTYSNFIGIDDNPITATIGQIIRATPDGWIVANVTDAVKYIDGTWTVLSKYSLQDLREYII